MSDPVERSDALDREILAIPADQVFTKRVMVTCLLVLGVVLAVGFVAMYLSLRRITADTNEVVRDEVVVLQDRNTELEDQHAVDEDLLRQSTDAIVLLIGTLQANGITPPEIVIRPTTTTTEPGG